MFALPCIATIQRTIRKLRYKPGLNSSNIEQLKAKVNPGNGPDRNVFILLDEMSLKSGLTYDQSSGCIYGYCDDGSTRSKKLVSSALCVMAVGVTRKWKHPLGYFLADSVMKSNEVIVVIEKTIAVMEEAGFRVLGFTTDGGSNFEKAFKVMGARPENPKFVLRNTSYLVHKDPPHLLKCARNFLERGDVCVPGFPGRARWFHIKEMWKIDQDSSLRLVHGVTERHLINLKFASRMKVKFAARVLSHSVAACINLMVSVNRLPAVSLATSSYCEMFNNIFDVLNSSSPKDSVHFRRPLHSKSPSLRFISEAKDWLYKLKRNNSDRKCHFIESCIQSLNVVCELNAELSREKLPYLSTRNICQDSLELFFGKIRQVCKTPNAYDFAMCYGKLSTASLIRAPISGNCEPDDDEEDEKLNNSIALTQYNPKTLDDEPLHPIPVSEEDKLFSGPTAVGGVLESTCVTHAASYFSGYVARKVSLFHQKTCKKALSECSDCENILAPHDLNTHLFLNFKEYKENIDSSWGLTYCSESFIDSILSFERLFLYCFHYYSYRPRFDRLVYDAIKSHCQFPKFCCEKVTHFYIKFFIKCRLFQCTKMFNSKFYNRSTKDKVKKLTNQ